MLWIALVQMVFTKNIGTGVLQPCDCPANLNQYVITTAGPDRAILAARRHSGMYLIRTVGSFTRCNNLQDLRVILNLSGGKFICLGADGTKQTKVAILNENGEIEKLSSGYAEYLVMLVVDPFHSLIWCGYYDMLLCMDRDLKEINRWTPGDFGLQKIQSIAYDYSTAGLWICGRDNAQKGKLGRLVQGKFTIIKNLRPRNNVYTPNAGIFWK